MPSWWKAVCVRPDDPPVGLNYVMRDEAGSWRIVDVLLDAKYSELARQKAEFAAVLQDGGVADLKALLQEQDRHARGRSGLVAGFRRPGPRSGAGDCARRIIA